MLSCEGQCVHGYMSAATICWSDVDSSTVQCVSFVIRQDLFVTSHVVSLPAATAEFNVGEYRRDAVGAKKSSEFFHPENKEAIAARMSVEC